MRFDIITIFPEIFAGFLSGSLIKKASDKKLIKIGVHNLRDFTNDRHKTVDDKPYGGGLGMVMKIEPIYKAAKKIKKKGGKVILFSPRGKKFNQKMAYKLSREKQLVFICGRYEGIDERVAKNIADLELSIGDFVTMGGEAPAMVVIEAIARLLPNVVGKKEFLKERGLKSKGFIEYAQYTRPEVFEPKKGVKWKVPKVLLTGHKRKVDEWRNAHAKIIEK